MARLKVKQLKTSSLGLERAQEDYRDYQRRQRGNKMSRLAYQLADSAKVEFAVVYSRTVMTAVSRVNGGRDNVIRYRTDTEEEEESAYEYDSEQDMAEVLVGKEEEEEEEEEEDLEVVEGFDHCHPVTESMSKCCLGGHC